MDNNGKALAGQVKGAAPKAKKQARLHIRIGDGEPASYDPLSLSDDDWTDLLAACTESGQQVVVTIARLCRWPDEPRYALLTLLWKISDVAIIRIGGKTFTDPFGAVLSAMSEATTLPDMQRMQRAAIEAAALFYGDAAELAAGKINQRLAQVGAPKLNHLHLVKQIRALAGGEVKPVGPQAVAEQFLAHLREQAELAEGEAVLRYHQQDFYLWRHPVWERLDDHRLQAIVTQYLQSLDLPTLTKRFVGDVVANLQGLALLDCWGESMPFMVLSESPLEIAHPRLIAFSNGALDLDEAVETDELPEPVAVDSRFFNEVALPYEYDPQATCPLWEQTLKDILPRKIKEDRRRLVLQEFLGYSLLQSCRFQKFLVLIGPGGNGKSVVTTTWESVLGEANVSDIRLDDLSGEFRSWALKGKLANFSGEIPYLGKVNEALLKRLVSGEPIDANRKHKDPVKLQTFAKLIVNTKDP